ncbi:MAG: translocation/assembly module TamB domain-containing protein [Crocinitomicaceae bacterium]
MVLLIFLAFAVRTSWFQTYAAQKVAAYLSGQWGTEVTIDKVDLVFFDVLDVGGVYVEDIRHDTLLYANELRINIADFDLSTPSVDIEHLSLNKADVFLKKYEGDTVFNFQHIIDYFGISEDTSSKAFQLNVETITLNDLHFIYQDQNADEMPFGIDYSNLDINHLYGSFSNFGLDGNEIYTSIKDLRLKERSGLVLSNLTTELTYGDDGVGLHDFTIALNNTRLNSDSLILRTPNGSSDFSDFVNKVYFSGNIVKSQVNLGDVSYFVPDIKGMKDMVNLNNIDLSGPVYGMRLSNTDITLLDSTIIRGNFRIPKFDDPGAIFFNQRITQFQTTVSDVESLKLTPFLGREDYLKLPQTMKKAGVIRLENGHFTGTLEDFVVDGDIFSGLGNVYSEYGLHFWLAESRGKEVYHFSSSGDNLGKDIELVGVDLAALTGNNLLGITTGYISVGQGSKGLSLDDMDIKFYGKFQQLELNDYAYQGIEIKKGSFRNNVFKGEIDVDDDNLRLVYDGSVDLKGQMKFDFDVRIDSAYLAELYKSKPGMKERFETRIKVNITGTSINEMFGTVRVNDLSYREGDIDFRLDSLELEIERSDSIDHIGIHSELLDLDLDGKFDLVDMWPIVQHQLARVADNLIADVPIEDSKNEFFDLSINLKDINLFLQFVDYEIEVAEGSKIESSYNLSELRLKTKITSDFVKYDGMYFEDIDLRNHFDSVRANVTYQVGKVEINDSLGVTNAAIFSYVKDNKFSTNLGWDGLGNVEPALFAFTTNLYENKDVVTEFKPSFFFLKSHKWDITPDSKLLWNNLIFEFTDFDIHNGDHVVKLDGRVSEDPNDWLYAQVRDFELSDLNGLLDGVVTLDGVLNIEGGVSDVYNKIRFMALSAIKDLVIDSELVGDVLLDSKWDRENESVSINGNLKRDSKETFQFTGNYFTAREKDNINLDLIFDYTDIGFLNAFQDPDLYTDIEGILNGTLEIRGEIDAPNINGVLDIVTANVKVPMFNVSFGLSGDVHMTTDQITADFLNVYDQEGNNAVASMEIKHDKWQDWRYTMDLAMAGAGISDRFLVMDTYYKDGDFYYGKAYISGDVNVKGTVDMTEINVSAVTEAGTDISLAMYGAGDLEESSFIVFDTIVPLYAETSADGVDGKIQNTGLIMNMNFDITKETRATIVFDPVYEDQIVVESGSGNIALNVDEYVEMDMFGDYTIDEGVYNMRVKGVARRDFILEPGSSLKWTKSPYDALIDIGATYKLDQINFQPILPPGLDNEIIADVDAKLLMTRTLMDPDLGFVIESKGAGELGTSSLKALDKDEIKKQFFALVALGRFLPTHGNSSNQGLGLTGIAEDQLNALLDKFDNGIAVDLDPNAASFDYSVNLGEKLTITTSLGLVSGDEESTGGIIGDIVVEYQLNDDGTFTINAFNESNQGADATEKGPFTQGVGLYYEETYNTWEQFKLLQGFLNIFRSSDKDVVIRRKSSTGRKRSVDAALRERENVDTGNDNDNN